MPWLQLTLEAGDLDVETLSDWFEQRGAVSVTLVDAADQPLFEPDPGTTPLWSATRLTAMFEADADADTLSAQLRQDFGAAAVKRLGRSLLEDQDWERVWLDQFHPMQFGERLWVCPAGKLPPQGEKPVIVNLDPGLAFGTGTHATTALCLEWLDANPPRDQAVLDYGSGSGILAVAALKLGAAALWAVDIDEQALLSTRDNAARNAVDDRLHTLFPAQLPEQAFDLLLANILANPLIKLAPDLAGRVRCGGNIVLSGILADQADAVREAYAPWFRLSDTIGKEGWVRLQGERI
ncbi:[LSU ribosomal protein L11P]-lysine N-methyltransferase [Thiogranum longum]|uniref:Ribosomal protein L11 methyltransferase n=1 Tax=Thiogranum longum TaxID=1537524 RepID=A0A4R1HBM4_9GAMM|nr:50S ribosomal protein L11 methyltransferase [Thiogranum longum]TCK19377.1 [LSU ribosomal protein L11P]-lysine N-methyltransferase [Thiogranum longum]